jgi:enoyl-CoA hydratase/carnithine racemase
MSSPVHVDQRGPALWITIDRPERRNAINAEVVGLIEDAIRSAPSRGGVRVIVLTGAGEKAFCAGGDLAPNASGAPFTADPAQPRHFVADLFKTIQDCDIPILCRVNGHALAGGLGLVCACDLVVTVDDASFGTPETRIGLFPMMILPLLKRVLPRRRLMELCITGDPITAQEALAAGLVNEVCPRAKLDERVEAWIERIAARSPTAVTLGKMAFHTMEDMGLRESLDYAQLMLPSMAQTEDAKEGFKAFQEKRAPNWPGR